MRDVGMTQQVRINTTLAIALERDAKALQMPMSQLLSMLLADALERARARRYAPYTLPEGYRFEQDNVRPFAQKKEAQG
jgi:hypothetical protein